MKGKVYENGVQLTDERKLMLCWRKEKIGGSMMRITSYALEA
jgi:hypothetical protein